MCWTQSITTALALVRAGDLLALLEKYKQVCLLHTTESHLDLRDGFLVIGHFLDTPKCFGNLLGVLGTATLLPLALSLVRARDFPELIEDDTQVCCTLLRWVGHVLDTPRGAVDTPGVC